jgi:hypothetical protein
MEPFTIATLWLAKEQPSYHARYAHSYTILNIDLGPIYGFWLVFVLIKAFRMAPTFGLGHVDFPSVIELIMRDVQVLGQCRVDLLQQDTEVDS